MFLPETVTDDDDLALSQHGGVEQNDVSLAQNVADRSSVHSVNKKEKRKS